MPKEKLSKTIDEILERLDLKLGMKVIDTKPDPMLNINDHVYTLVKKHHEMLAFKNSDGWFFEVFYVLTQLGKRFKVIEDA